MKHSTKEKIINFVKKTLKYKEPPLFPYEQEKVISCVGDVKKLKVSCNISGDPRLNTELAIMKREESLKKTLFETLENSGFIKKNLETVNDIAIKSLTLFVVKGPE